MHTGIDVAALIAVAGLLSGCSQKPQAPVATTTAANGAQVAQVAQVAPDNPDAIERLLPPHTIAYAAIDDVTRARDDIAHTALGATLREKEVQAFLARPLARLSNVLAQIEVKTGLPRRDVAAAFDGQVGLALVELAPSEHRGSPDLALVLATRPADMAAARRLVAWFAKVIRAGDPAVGDFARPGWTGVVMPADDLEVTVAAHERVAVVALASPGSAAIADVCAAVERPPETSLATDEEFVSAREHVGGPGILFTYLSVDRLRDALLAIVREDDPDGAATTARVVDALGLGAVHSWAGAFRAEPPGIVQTTWVHAPAPRIGLVGLFPDEPLGARTTALMRAGALSLTAGRFSFSRVMTVARNVAATLDQSAAFDDAFVQVKAMTGIDIEKDVLGQLGDEVALVVFAPKTGGAGTETSGIEGVAIALQARDVAAFTALTDKLLGMADMVLRSQNAGSIEDSSHMNVRVRYMRLANARGIPAAAAALVGDRFVLAGSVATAKQMVRVLSRDGAPTTTDAGFETLLGHVGGAIGPSLTCTDLRQTTSYMLDQLGQLARAAGPSAARTADAAGADADGTTIDIGPYGTIEVGTADDWVDVALLPSSGAFMKHLFNQIGTTRSGDDGFTSIEYGPIGGLGAPSPTGTTGLAIVAAIAIPNLVQSRTASNETSAVASIVITLAGQATFHKTDFYGTGQLVYANARDGRGAADLYDLPDGRVIGLIDQSLAAAFLGTAPKAGYYFSDLAGVAEGDDYLPEIEFAVCAAPAAYGRSGRNVFVMDTGGVLYQADAKTLFGDLATGDRVPLLSRFPSADQLEKHWIAVGN